MLRPTRMLPIHRILVPTDFSEPSDRAVDCAIELARKLDASVTLVHAYEIPAYSFADGAVVGSADLAARLSDGAQRTLDAAVAARKHAGVPVDGVLRQGIAWEEIDAVAKERKADLVVVGTHGRRGLARAVLGSVAEQVIRTCEVPVLTVHAGAREG